jgi:hypothetical protein
MHKRPGNRVRPRLRLRCTPRNGSGPAGDLPIVSSVQGICPPLVRSATFKRASSMSLAWATVTGKMTRSLRSSSGQKISSTTSLLGPDVRRATLGIDARRAVGSTATRPSAPIVLDRKVSDEIAFP